MKQKLTLLSLGIGIALNANAQRSLFSVTPEQAKHLRTVNSIIQRNTSTKNTHHKPTAIRQRVIAQVTVSEEGTDSVHYTYSGTKGSYYNYNRVFEPGYSTEFLPELSPAFVMPDQIASKDVLADNIASFYATDDAEESIAYYNASGNIDSAITTYAEYSDKSSLLYNSEGQVTQYKQEYFSGGMLGGGSLRKIAYSGSEIATDSSFTLSGSTWGFTGRIVYNYDGTGRISEAREYATSADNYNLYKFRYDASGRLRATEGSMVIGSMSIPTATDTIGYTEGTDYLTFYQNIYSGDFGSFGFRVNQYPGSHAGPDSIKVDNFDEDVWVSQGTGHFTYNEFDNPEKLEVVAGDVDPEELIGMMRFYYETYDDGVSSTDDVTLKSQFGIYPNPFVDNLNIAYKGTDKASMQLQLSDISGRVIFKGNKQLNAGINTINLPQLPAGAYILVIKNEMGDSFAQKIIRK